jgi:hypothetical protein
MKPMASSEEIAWAAGLFEGEGCISHMQRGSGLDLQIALAMTDEEVVRRFDAVVDRGRVYGPYLPPSHGSRRKQFWRWAARGDTAHDVLDLIGPWLMSRRSEQARRCGVTLEGFPVKSLYPSD